MSSSSEGVVYRRPPASPSSTELRASSSPSRTAVVLAAHGTRDPEGAREALAFADALSARLDPGVPLVPCFLELTDPPILDTLGHLAASGAREVVVAPLMLFGAAHVKNDIPAALTVARARHPGLTIKYGAPLGVQPEMLDILDERLSAVEAAAPPCPRERTAVLLVERGSSDPDANAQVFHLARLLWEGRSFGWVEACFIGITRPTLPEGIARCAALGAERVIVLPYFLFTGVLVRRISQTVDDLAATYPALDLRVAEHLGVPDRLLDLAARRVAEAAAGAVAMSCDRCIYRVPLVGFGHRVRSPQRSDHAHGLREHGMSQQHGHGA